MNTTSIKKYAPKARTDFIAAVTKRLNQLGIYADKAGELTISESLISGSVMQIDGNSFDVSLNKSRKRLTQKVNQQGFNQYVEHTAYTWFNRLCAIRYMELHDYLDHGLRVLSPAPSQGVTSLTPSPSEDVVKPTFKDNNPSHL